MATAKEILEYELQSRKSRLAFATAGLANDLRDFAVRLGRACEEGQNLPSHIPLSMDGLVTLFRDFEAAKTLHDAIQTINSCEKP